jgi:hypothetical protein
MCLHGACCMDVSAMSVSSKHEAAGRVGPGLYDKRFYEFANKRWPNRWTDELTWKACKASLSKLTEFGIFDSLKTWAQDHVIWTANQFKTSDFITWSRRSWSNSISTASRSTIGWPSLWCSSRLRPTTARHSGSRVARTSSRWPFANPWPLPSHYNAKTRRSIFRDSKSKQVSNIFNIVSTPVNDSGARSTTVMY